MCKGGVMMNDFEFGNRLYNLRVKCKLSQSELGKMVGVTNKAVSKWEMGNAKPGIEIMNKLSLIFNVPLQDLINEKNVKPNINMIVITGGPCAGKSTALSWIQNEFTQKGYHVIFINEAATELINNGISFNTCKDKVVFQEALMKMQREREEIYLNAATKMPYEKILIVCDRGILDSKAFLSELEFQYLMKELKVNEIELRDNYDAVFHLVSAAKGAEKFYTLENNKARSEGIEEARCVDNKLIAAWTGHPHFRIIDNSTDFNEKMKRLIAEISAFLGEPEPFEIERKYLIEYPNVKQLEGLSNCEKVEVIQTYLISEDDSETRIRQRGKDGNYIYYKTIKKKISDIKRLEIEKRLTKEEYLNLLMNADPSYRQIRKTRYCLTYDKLYYEIDIFPFWKDKAIMEIELKNEDEEIEIPPFINVIKEVTDDDTYKNKSLARI